MKHKRAAAESTADTSVTIPETNDLGAVVPEPQPDEVYLGGNPEIQPPAESDLPVSQVDFYAEKNTPSPEGVLPTPVAQAKRNRRSKEELAAAGSVSALVQPLIKEIGGIKAELKKQEGIVEKSEAAIAKAAKEQSEATSKIESLKLTLEGKNAELIRRVQS